MLAHAPGTFLDDHRDRSQHDHAPEDRNNGKNDVGAHAQDEPLRCDLGSSPLLIAIPNAPSG
ncbi:MAG: hypothetical protein WBA46_04170 [Thermomicrobiales bacterium]